MSAGEMCGAWDGVTPGQGASPAVQRTPLAPHLMPGLPRPCRPPEMQPVVWNRTVRACCRGWSGPHCTEGRDGHWGAVAPPALPLGTEPAEQPVLSSRDDSRLSAAGEGSLGRCYGTWQCQDTASSRNLSDMSLAECCRHPWGHSWRNGSTTSCLACTHLPLAGESGAPRGLWGGPGWFCGARAE